MYLALSIYILFTSLMQLVNETQFLNSTSISLFPPSVATYTARKIIFSFLEYHGKLSKYNFSINFLAEKRPYLPSPKSSK